jgi:hypothetical protein
LPNCYTILNTCTRLHLRWGDRRWRSVFVVRTADTETATNLADSLKVPSRRTGAAVFIEASAAPAREALGRLGACPRLLAALQALHEARGGETALDRAEHAEATRQVVLAAKAEGILVVGGEALFK